MDEQRVLPHCLCPGVLFPGEVLIAIGFIAAEVIVPLLCCFCDPVPGILRRTVVPTQGEICGAELLRRHGQGGEKLIVQLRELLRIILAHARDVQSVPVSAECVPIIVPAHIVLAEPAIALEHTLG